MAVFKKNKLRSQYCIWSSRPSWAPPEWLISRRCNECPGRTKTSSSSSPSWPGSNALATCAHTLRWRQRHPYVIQKAPLAGLCERYWKQVGTISSLHCVISSTWELHLFLGDQNWSYAMKVFGQYLMVTDFAGRKYSTQGSFDASTHVHRIWVSNESLWTISCN